MVFQRLRYSLEPTHTFFSTYHQFRDGFKKLALEQPALVSSVPSADTSLNTWLDEVFCGTVCHPIFPDFTARFSSPSRFRSHLPFSLSIPRQIESRVNTATQNLCAELLTWLAQ